MLLLSEWRSSPPIGGELRHSLARSLSHSVNKKSAETGSSIVEFALISIQLVLLLLAILQVAIYLHIRNVAVASAAEGARYAANADVAVDSGASRAIRLIQSGVGSSAAQRISCIAGQATDAGLVVVNVRCAGSLPVFFAPLGKVIPLDVTAHSVAEEQ